MIYARCTAILCERCLCVEHALQRPKCQASPLPPTRPTDRCSTVVYVIRSPTKSQVHAGHGYSRTVTPIVRPSTHSRKPASRARLHTEAVSTRVTPATRAPPSPRATRTLISLPGPWCRRPSQMAHVHARRTQLVQYGSHSYRRSLSIRYCRASERLCMNYMCVRARVCG